MRRHASSRYSSYDTDRDADRLNNDLGRDRRNSNKSSPKEKREQLCEATTVVEHLPTERNATSSADRPRDAMHMVDVEIWTSSAFLRDRIGSAPHRQAPWLRVVGNGCSSAKTQPVLRPSTAPSTVKRVHLTPRSPLSAYRPHVVSTPRLPTRKPKPRKTVEKSPQLGVQGKETLCEKKKENDAALAKKKSPIVAGEMTRRDQLKNRRAIAKSKAEKTFRQLLDLDEGDNPKCPPSLRFPPYIEPNPVPGREGTICFKGIPSEKEERGLVAYRGKKLLVHFSGMASSPVRLTFLKAGFRVTKSPTKWNVLWGIAPSAKVFERMNRFQRVNHFPGSSELGRKDRLCRNYRAMQKRHPTEFRFMPKCFLLPEDRVALRQDMARFRRRLYIVKPVAASCGRGIRITSNPVVFTCAQECVVQRYLAKPMTIDGFKFDLRIYAGVTSYRPMRAYVYGDGLVRFATKPYTSSKGHMDNRYVHITNTSINRRSSDYVKNRDAESADRWSKWSIHSLRAYLVRNRLVEWSHVWNQIRDIVAKTFWCVEERMVEHLQAHRVPYSTSCFEIYGFDILLDASYRAWLLEVNTWPDLAGSSPLDQKLKTELIEDMMHMIGVVPRGPPARQTMDETQVAAARQEQDENSRRGAWEVIVARKRSLRKPVVTSPVSLGQLWPSD